VPPVSDRGVELSRVGEGEPVRRAERVKGDQLGDRARAMTALRALVTDAASDEAVCAAWWAGVRLGCILPSSLIQAGRTARRREIERRLATLPPYTAKEPEAAAPHFPQPPAPSLRQLFAVAELDQSRALQELAAALEADDLWRIADAAETVRLLGAFDPEIHWSRVEDAEAMVKGAGELRASLRADDKSGAASAWFRISSLWPGSLSAEDDALGRAAFRAWGHALRRSSPEGTTL
jgi:hypothetical protein